MVALKGALKAIEEQIRASREKLAEADIPQTSDVEAVTHELTAEEVYAMFVSDQEGTSVDLFIAQANKLQVERGAYIVRTVQGGPAEQAGLQGGVETVNVDGLDVPKGGDVIIEANGVPINDYADLQALIAMQEPGTEIDLTVLRNGETQMITVPLAPRPTN